MVGGGGGVHHTADLPHTSLYLDILQPTSLPFIVLSHPRDMAFSQMPCWRMLRI